MASWLGPIRLGDAQSLHSAPLSLRQTHPWVTSPSHPHRVHCCPGSLRGRTGCLHLCCPLTVLALLALLCPAPTPSTAVFDKKVGQAGCPPQFSGHRRWWLEHAPHERQAEVQTTLQPQRLLERPSPTLTVSRLPRVSLLQGNIDSHRPLTPDVPE